MKRAVAYAGVAAAMLTLLAGLARRVDGLEPGLAAQYADDSHLDPGRGVDGAALRRTLTRIDAPPFSTALANTWQSPSPTAFSVTWTGQLSVFEAGTYSLAVNADAGTSLFVDGRTIFDNVQHPDDQFSFGEAALSRGSHTVFISYANRGDAPRLELLWRRNAAPYAAIPGQLLRPRRAGELRVRWASLLEDAPVAFGWFWAAFLAIVGVVGVRSIVRAAIRSLRRAHLWRELRWILAGSLALSLTGFWWGLPAAWVPIELTPTFVLDGLAHHFSQGWYDAYPPLHYYILAAAISPMLVLQSVAGVDIYGVTGHTIMVIIFRLVSVMAGAGIVVCVCLVGREIFGDRAGLFAAAAFALTTPFVFYSKTANVDVPYLFWFSVSMVFYIRLVERLALVDFLGLAAAAACAVCTKDQAYGFYVLVPFVVVERVWRHNRQKGTPRALLRALIDARVLAAAATAAVLFAAFHNLLFNFDGFKGHVAFIIGPGSDTYRIFEPTLAGRRQLLELTVHLVQQSMGWPLFVFGVVGTIAALVSNKRVLTICLLVPVVSYYLFFIDVILYNYDRFVLPMCFVMAVLAGFLTDQALVRAGRARAIVGAMVALAFAYTLLYSSTVDVLMLRDSRYEAERWMTKNVGGQLVGVTELPELIPAVSDFRTAGVATIEELEEQRPRYVVLNADYARAAAPGTPWAALVDGVEQGTLGYHPVAHFRSAPPWPWLPGAHADLVGPRQETVVFSVLRDVNPTIDIFEREP